MPITIPEISSVMRRSSVRTTFPAGVARAQLLASGTAIRGNTAVASRAGVAGLPAHHIQYVAEVARYATAIATHHRLRVASSSRDLRRHSTNASASTGAKISNPNC